MWLSYVTCEAFLLYGAWCFGFFECCFDAGHLLIICSLGASFGDVVIYEDEVLEVISDSEDFYDPNLEDCLTLYIYRYM